MNCIFCKKETGKEPVEHIIPEGLVGDQEYSVSRRNGRNVTLSTRLVLSDGEVCGECNNGEMGKLDENLQKQMGIFKIFWNPLGTKSGKPVKVDDRSGMYAVRRSDGPHIFLNSGKKTITTDDGVIIHPPKNRDDAVRVTSRQSDARAGRVQFGQPMRLNKKFFRGLYKMAFELLCFQEGPAIVMDARFDPIREYIRYGRGSRAIIATTQKKAGQWEKPEVTLHKIPGTADWIVDLLGFFVDLSPDNHVGEGRDAQLEAEGFKRLKA